MPTITTKEAVSMAKETISQLYSDDPLESLALEEIELINEDGEQLWAVTLGFYRPKSITIKGGGIGSMLRPAQVENRDYKTVFINANSGEFVKMEIRPAP
jgi:hypothetical protein